jgi:hypothetical protein
MKQSADLPPSLSRYLSPWHWLAGIVLVAALINVIDHYLGWEQILKPWQKVNPALAALAFVFIAVSHILRAMRIHSLTKDKLSSQLSATIKISALHQLANNIMPMRLGELTYPLLMRRYYSVPVGDSISQLIWLRVLDLALMGAVAFILLLVVLNHSLVTLSAAAAILISVFIAIAVRTTAQTHFMALVSSRSWLNKPFLVLRDNVPSTKKHHAYLLLLTVAAWGFKLCAASLVILFFADVSITSALTGSIAGEVAGILPIQGVAGAGTYEAIVFTGISLSEGIEPNWLAVAFNMHLFMLTCTAIVAVLALPIAVPRGPLHVSHSRSSIR